MLILEGLTAKGKPLLDHLMVKDHQLALEEILRLAKNKSAISSQLIQHINAFVMRNTGTEINTAMGTFDSSKGDFRKVAVHAGTRYFADAQKVAVLTANFCDGLGQVLDKVKSPIEIYNLAFEAHFRLVEIHPFADGNGRTARLLMNYILAYHQQPLAIVYKEDKEDKEDKKEYIASLDKSMEINDTTLFKNFMFKQQICYFKNEIKMFKPKKCTK